MYIKINSWFLNLYQIHGRRTDGGWFPIFTCIFICQYLTPWPNEKWLEPEIWYILPMSIVSKKLLSYVNFRISPHLLPTYYHITVFILALVVFLTKMMNCTKQYWTKSNLNYRYIFFGKRKCLINKNIANFLDKIIWTVDFGDKFKFWKVHKLGIAPCFHLIFTMLPDVSTYAHC